MKNWLPVVLKIIKGDLEGKAELSHIKESFRQYLRKKQILIFEACVLELCLAKMRKDFLKIHWFNRNFQTLILFLNMPFWPWVTSNDLGNNFSGKFKSRASLWVIIWLLLTLKIFDLLWPQITSNEPKLLNWDFSRKITKFRKFHFSTPDFRCPQNRNQIPNFAWNTAVWYLVYRVDSLVLPNRMSFLNFLQGCLILWRYETPISAWESLWILVS